MACRYFDPAAITVPADALTLQTAVMIKLDVNLTYKDAVTAATDPGTWNVAKQTEYTVAGYPATLVEATSTHEANGIPVGTTVYAYLVDLGSAGTGFIETVFGVRRAARREHEHGQSHRLDPEHHRAVLRSAVARSAQDRATAFRGFSATSATLRRTGGHGPLCAEDPIARTRNPGPGGQDHRRRRRDD